MYIYNFRYKANENKQSENTNINFMAMAPIDIVENDQNVNFFFYIHISSLVAKLNFILVWNLYFCSYHSIELKRKKIRLSICVSKCSETILVHYWALLSYLFMYKTTATSWNPFCDRESTRFFGILRVKFIRNALHAKLYTLTSTILCSMIPSSLYFLFMYFYESRNPSSLPHALILTYFPFNLFQRNKKNTMNKNLFSFLFSSSNQHHFLKKKTTHQEL